MIPTKSHRLKKKKHLAREAPTQIFRTTQTPQGNSCKPYFPSGTSQGFSIVNSPNKQEHFYWKKKKWWWWGIVKHKLKPAHVSSEKLALAQSMASCSVSVMILSVSIPLFCSAPTSQWKTVTTAGSFSKEYVSRVKNRFGSQTSRRQGHGSESSLPASRLVWKFLSQRNGNFGKRLGSASHSGTAPAVSLRHHPVLSP